MHLNPKYISDLRVAFERKDAEGAAWRAAKAEQFRDVVKAVRRFAGFEPAAVSKPQDKNAPSP